MTDYIHEEIVASACFYAIASAFMIVSVFYAFGLLVRSVIWKKKIDKKNRQNPNSSRLAYNNFANDPGMNRFGNFGGPRPPPYHYNYANE